MPQTPSSLIRCTSLKASCEISVGTLKDCLSKDGKTAKNAQIMPNCAKPLNTFF